MNGEHEFKLCDTACSFNHLGSKITADVTAVMKLRHLLPGREGMTKLDSVLKRHHFADKGPYSQSYSFFQ